MIILGIDPGTATTGYGVIEIEKIGEAKKTKFLKCLSYGTIKTLPTSSAPERLKKIYNELSKLIKVHNPEILAVESLFFFRNLKTAIPVSQAKGVILLTAAKNNLPVKEFTPMQVKLAITGFGWSEKEKVQKRMMSILKLKDFPKSDDAADALAIAITFCLKESA